MLALNKIIFVLFYLGSKNFNLASALFSSKRRISLDSHRKGLLFIFFGFHLRVASHPRLVLQLLDFPLEVELVRVPGCLPLP